MGSTKQTTFHLPEQLYKQIKIRAVEEGITLSELGIRALTDYLKKPGSK